MKRILLFVGLIALLGGQAHAAMNIRQNPDGTADWVGARPDDPFFSQCVGAVHIDREVSLNATVTTQTALSPITNAVLRNIQAIIPANTMPNTATQANLRFFLGTVSSVQNTTHPLSYRSQNSDVATAIDLIINFSQGGLTPTRGRVFTISSPIQAGPAVSVPRLVSNTVMRNDPIFIQAQSLLGTNNMVSAHVLLTLCPR